MSQGAFIHLVWGVIRRVEAESGMDGLTLRSRFLLDIIGETSDEPLRVSDLIRQAQAGTAPTIYSGLAELEKGGWIARDDDPRDGRSYRLRLTQKARRAYAKMSRDIAKLGEG